MAKEMGVGEDGVGMRWAVAAGRSGAGVADVVKKGVGRWWGLHKPPLRLRQRHRPSRLPHSLFNVGPFAQMLLANAARLGVDLSPIQDYVDAFQVCQSPPPHRHLAHRPAATSSVLLACRSTGSLNRRSTFHIRVTPPLALPSLRSHGVAACGCSTVASRMLVAASG